jgi:hypothetical protein
MTLHPRELSTIPPDTAAVAGPLLPAANPYRVLGEQLAEVLTDADFAPLYLAPRPWRQLSRAWRW